MDIPPVKKVFPSFPLLLLLPILLNARIEYTTTRLLSNAHYILRVLNDKNDVEKFLRKKISHNNPNYKSTQTTTTNYL